MKIATIIIRILLGLLMVMSSIVVLFNLVPQPELSGPVKTFMEGIMASGYLLSLIKITELICGLALISGFYAPLATVILFPISLNIFLYHTSLDTSGLPVSLFVILANIFLAFAYRKHYRGLMVARG